MVLANPSDAAAAPTTGSAHAGTSPSSPSTVADSSRLYGLEGWGDPYFTANARGHVMVQPRGDRGGSLDLVELVRELQGRDLTLPPQMRCDDIVEDQLIRAAIRAAAGVPDRRCPNRPRPGPPRCPGFAVC